MMKAIACLALVAIVVSAGEYKFTQPKFPCAFQMKVVSDGRELFSEVINGRFFKLVQYDAGVTSVGVSRSDITKKEGDVEKIAYANAKNGKCESGFVPLKDYLGVLKTYSEDIFAGMSDKTWKNKKNVTFNGKDCTAYYDDDIEEGAIYVYDGYIYAYADKFETTIFDFKLEAPLSEFVLEECKSENKKFAETPSEDYVFCSSSSVKVAFAAILVALLCAFFW